MLYKVEKLIYVVTCDTKTIDLNKIIFKNSCYPWHFA